MAAPPAPYGPVKKKSVLPWVLGGIGILAVIAVVLVLVLVVFRGGSDTSGPEKVVDTFFQSLEKQDVDMMLGTWEPDYIGEIKDALGKDYRDLLDEYFFMAFPEDLEFNVTKYETEVKGDQARVKLVEGTVTYTDEYGDKITNKASESDMKVLKLVKKDGKWYISSATLKEMGLDPSDLGDSSLDNTSSDVGQDLNDGLTQDVVLPVDTEDEVLTLVSQLPEVQDWIATVDEPLYDITDENTSYVIHLYEIVDDGTASHTATFAWYAVDKETGEVYEVVE
jgi:hypothetical protein